MDTAMALYILGIFRHYPSIVLSWGFNDLVAVENGLRFNVQGYLHNGKVEVMYDEGSDLFVVRLFSPDGSVKHVEEGIYLDNLVDVVDGLVERCANYAQRVKETCGLISK